MNFLDKISDFQVRHANWIIVFVLIFAAVIGSGVSKISMQSDLDQMMPQDLEIYKLADSVDDHFGRQDASMILLRIGESDKEGVYDIRDPKVIKFMVELEDSLENEDLIEGVQSAGMIFDEDSIPETLGESVGIYSSLTGLSGFFNKDYSATMIMISSDLGGGEGKIKELEALVSEKVSMISRPEGLEVYITGTPQIRSMILDLLASDAIYTLSLASLIIFILLIAMERSFTKALLIFMPLLLGIILTLGTMGWFGVQLSIATVGIGAMILGLGVEYGVFIVSRYSEERKSKSAKIALQTSVREVGSSVLGSGMTTVMGFLALTLSMMPMLRDLGLSLALGIGFSLIAAVFVNPVMIVLEERLEHWMTERQHAKIVEKKERHEERRKFDGSN